MKDIYIRANDRATYNNIVKATLASPFGFEFPNGLKPPTFEYAKTGYHGNSNLLLHLFYNNITRKKYEMQATTKTVELSYPQIKHIDIINYEQAAPLLLKKGDD